MSAYNCAIYHYPNGMQIRYYNRPITDEKIEEEKEFIEEPFTNTLVEYKEEKQKNEADEEEKKSRSKYVADNRAKNKVFEYARANNWDYFITLTFDRNKVDSSDYMLCFKKVNSFFNNMRKRKAPDLKYLIVPELHSDGVHYHFHGLLANCGSMEFVDSGIVQNGVNIYNMTDFHYGFTTASKVKDSRRVSTYISKYISKQLEVRIFGHRRYLASKNLETPVVEYLNISPEEKLDLMENYSKYITFMKDLSVPEASLRISYLEVDFLVDNMKE